MNGKELSAALREGKRVYGTCVLSPSPHWPGMIKNLGLDMVFIDTEHIALARETLSWMCRTYAALNVAPVVRIPEPDPFQACIALDGGAQGVIAPYIESAEQARALRGALKMRPLKGKLLERALTSQVELNEAMQNYLANRNPTTLILMIESVPGMEALDEILAVPQIDAVLIGPNDLSISLGIPDQYEHPLFDQAVRTIIGKARARGIGAGIHFFSKIEQEIAWANAGANLIMHYSDIGLVGKTLAADLKAFHDALDAPTQAVLGADMETRV